MRFWRSVGGIASAELTGAEPGATLSAFNTRGIRLRRVEYMGDLTVRFLCERGDMQLIKEICQKRGDKICILKETGVIPIFEQLLGRPVLLSGAVFFMALSLFLPSRVLFFQVEGNERIPSNQILEAAERCGIRFGISRRSVRSEKMKNALLSSVPELKWAGINTSGCTAVISVRERQEEKEQGEALMVSKIIAARDGYVTSCTVTKGNSLCSPGQIVKKGQVLISGYTDCGICIQLTQAEGEVFAETNRQLRVLSPLEYTKRVLPGPKRRRYSLIIGKKRINFWKGSGISDTSCGRMYEEYYFALPGGFQLPVCVAVETLTGWDTVRKRNLPEELEEPIKIFASSMMLEQTVAGKILQEDYSMAEERDCLIMAGRFHCSEMIGRVITEEIGEANGKTD